MLRNGISHRALLFSVPASSAGVPADAGWAVPKGPRAKAIPSHLPDRLAICYIGWEWITETLADEPYGDLDRVMRSVKARGFNAVRTEMGLNWMFDMQGRRRGKVKFRG